MGARPLFFKPLTGEIKTMKIFTNHRYALITGIVLAIVLSYCLHRALVPDSEFNHLSLARWVHIVSGIFWIGLLYYLNAVQVPALAAAAGAVNESHRTGPSSVGATSRSRPPVEGRRDREVAPTGTSPRLGSFGRCVPGGGSRRWRGRRPRW